MKQATVADLARRIEEVSRSSALGPRVRQVEVEAEDSVEGGAFLRVLLHFEHPDELEWTQAEPLVRSIEDAVAELDERFPSVRFADAA